MKIFAITFKIILGHSITATTGFTCFIESTNEQNNFQLAVSSKILRFIRRKVKWFTGPKSDTALIIRWKLAALQVGKQTSSLICLRKRMICGRNRVFARKRNFHCKSCFYALLDKLLRKRHAVCFPLYIMNKISYKDYWPSLSK